ncbi:MAG: class I SAM-dependent methyltransferase [Candidatus Thorarchaeota archaeon]
MDVSLTVRHFYDVEILKGILREAGVSRIDHHHMSLGLAAIHRVLKRTNTEQE